MPIPCAWRVDSDWNSFLGISARCLDRNEDLTQALCMFSALKFLRENAKLVSEFLRSLGLVVVSDHLYMHYVMYFNWN